MRFSHQRLALYRAGIYNVVVRVYRSTRSSRGDTDNVGRRGYKVHDEARARIDSDTDSDPEVNSLEAVNWRQREPSLQQFESHPTRWARFFDPFWK